VREVARRGAELGVALDHLLDGVQEVLLAGHLAPGADGEHARLGAHAAHLGARAVGAEACQQLVPDVALDAHLLHVDPEDVRAPLRERQ